MNLPRIDQAENIAGKRVFLRGDIDVPLGATSGEQSVVRDDTRLRGIWPTVEYLLGQQCPIYLAGHLGRPEKGDGNLSSQMVAVWFWDRLGQLQFPQNSGGKNLVREEKVSRLILPNGLLGFKVANYLTVLENLRFDSREEGNDGNFARRLASLADVYVNDAFAASERVHASLVGVPRFLPHFAGFRLLAEIEMLGRVLNNPRRPLVAVIGGAKLETKIPVLTRMMRVADDIIVGGKLLDGLARLTVSSELREGLRFLELTSDGRDCTISSIEKYQLLLARAGTIVWNGPLGVVEESGGQAGTQKIAEVIVGNTDAYKVVGGGDTVAFLGQLGLVEKFAWVSSGGGSMLHFLSGEQLPGIEALQQ